MVGLKLGRLILGRRQAVWSALVNKDLAVGGTDRLDAGRNLL
jgi:hypothetical protein